MIVLVGAVFADPVSQGTAQVEITASITEELPTFRLSVVDGTNYTVGTRETSINGADPETKGAVTIAADALDDASKDVTVSFKIQQVADALTYKTFYFSVAATDLTLQTDANVNSTALAALTAAQKTLSIQGGESGVLNPTITMLTIANTDAPASGTGLKYKGIRVAKAANSEALDVATFTCTWDGNAQAVPGTYKGTVTLTVSAE